MEAVHAASLHILLLGEFSKVYKRGNSEGNGEASEIGVGRAFNL